MSAFIPMVSTTPPPIDDDDDFGDFMDGGADENDDFADFSSPKDFDDFSYPSLNPASDNVNSYDQGSDNDEPPSDMPVLYEDAEDGSCDQEVKKVIGNGYQEPGTVESQNSIQLQCNGNTAEDDHFRTSNDNNASVPISKNNEYDEGSLTEQTNIFIDSVPAIEKDKPEDEPNTNHQENSCFDNTSRADLEQGLELTNEHFPENNDVVEHTVINDFVAPVPTDTCNVEHLDPEQQEEVINDNKLDMEVADTIPPSKESLSNVAEDDSTEEEHVLGQSISSMTAHSLESSAAEEAENTDNDCDDFIAQEPAPLAGIDRTAQEEEVTLSESDEIKFDERHQDFTVDDKDDVDQQDSQHSSQTSINNTHISHNPVSESQGNEDTAIDSDQNLSFHADFGNSDDEHDFADFGAFDSQPVSETENENPPTNTQFNAFENNAALTDHNDGFADISNAGTNELTRDSDDFGDFSTTDNADDEEFGDFDSNSPNWAGFSDTVTKKFTFHEKVNSFVSRYAVEMNEDVDARIPHLDEHLISDTLPKDAESHSMGSMESAGIVWPGDLWDQLEDIDNTTALNFVWNGSHHNKYLLDALGMQTQNILFSGTKQAYYVPAYYAAALGMVDPNKGIMKPMSAAEKITAMSPTEKNFPVGGEVSAEEPHPEWKTIADEQTSGQRMNVADSWLRTDRTACNQDDSPITSNTLPILPSALDLDYFDNLPNATENPKLSGGTDLIDPELLEVTSSPTTEPPPPPKDPGNATLSKILASIKGDSHAPTSLTTQYSPHQDNSKWADEENKLSTEARAVLQKLPDLSYMRSKVLIFPMNMSRMTIGEE